MVLNEIPDSGKQVGAKGIEVIQGLGRYQRNDGRH